VDYIIKKITFGKIIGLLIGIYGYKYLIGNFCFEVKDILIFIIAFFVSIGIDEISDRMIKPKNTL